MKYLNLNISSCECVQHARYVPKKVKKLQIQSNIPGLIIIIIGAERTIFESFILGIVMSEMRCNVMGRCVQTSLTDVIQTIFSNFFGCQEIFIKSVQAYCYYNFFSFTYRIHVYYSPAQVFAREYKEDFDVSLAFFFPFYNTRLNLGAVLNFSYIRVYPFRATRRCKYAYICTPINILLHPL